MINTNCPACDTPSETRGVERRELITMQNYIYRDRDDAVNAPVGSFQLYFCRTCGLVFNAAFDRSLVTYDPTYSSYIPSVTFENYYHDIAEFLNRKFALDEGLIVDIACGKGDFLDLLCRTNPRARGLGIDPSFDRNEDGGGSAEFITDIFREEHIAGEPAIVLCRHAFDQIENPLDFLIAVKRSLANYGEVPFFIEVGDLEWMLRNRSFSDLCYERCSFFTAESLNNILRLAGFKVEAVDKAFGKQYLWAYGTVRKDDAPVPASELGFKDSACIAHLLPGYSAQESRLIARMKDALGRVSGRGYLTAVWGMATKGAVFCNLIDQNKDLFDYCIDINRQKHNCFVPRTGHRITGISSLMRAERAKAVVVVMNPNYLAEIKECCSDLDLRIEFWDANGRVLGSSQPAEKRTYHGIIKVATN